MSPYIIVPSNDDNGYTPESRLTPKREKILSILIPNLFLAIIKHNASTRNYFDTKNVLLQ